MRRRVRDSAAAGRVRASLDARPGRIESVGQVKRRLLVVAIVSALTIVGVYSVTGSEALPSPFSDTELKDLSGLPKPPVHFVQDQDGSLRELTPAEQEQLRQLQDLIRNFPAPQIFGGGLPTPRPSGLAPSANNTGGG